MLTNAARNTQEYTTVVITSSSSSWMEEIQQDLSSYSITWPTTEPPFFQRSSSMDDVESAGTAAVKVNTYFCRCYDFVIEAVLMGALCLLGLVGNAVSMVCLSRDGSKTATPFLLVSLAAADTLFLVTVFLLRVLTSVDTPFSTAAGLPSAWMQPAVPYLAKYIYPVALVAQTATIYLTILVTTNRYVAVCWPYRVADWCSLYYTRRHVVTTLLFAVVFNLPRFFEYDIVYIDSRQQLSTTAPRLSVSELSERDVVSTTMTSSVLTACSTSTDGELHPHMGSTSSDDSLQMTLNGHGRSRRVSVQHSQMALSALYRILYSNVLYMIVLFVVPLVSLTFLNQRLAAELRRTRLKRARLRGTAAATRCSLTADGQDAEDFNSRQRPGDCPSTSIPAASLSQTSRRLNHPEDDITQMLIVVVIVFVVTQLPAAVTQTAASVLDPTAANCPNPLFFYGRISDLLVVANSSVNFLIYCLCSRRFRQILMTVVCRRQQQQSTASTSAAQGSH